MRIVANDKRSLNVGIIFCVLSLAGMLISASLTHRVHNEIPDYFFAAMLIMHCCSSFLLLKNKKFISQKAAGQALLCYVPFLLFYISAFVYQMRSSGNINWTFAILDFVTLVIGVVCWAVIFACKKETIHCKHAKVQKESVGERFFCFARRNGAVALILLILCILCFDMFDFEHKWDTAQYSWACMGLRDFSFVPSDIKLFEACGHMSYAFTFLYGIGFFFFNDHLVGMRVINLLILCATVVCLHLLLNRLFPSRKVLNNLAVAIFAVTPIIVGPIYQISPELLLVFAFVALVLAIASRSYILAFFFAFLFVYTKEICAVYLAAFAFGVLIYELFQKDKKKLIQKVKSALPVILVCFIPCIFFAIEFVLIDTVWGSEMRQEGGSVSTAYDRLNTIGFNKAIFYTKTIQLVVLNFNWLIIGLIVVGLIVALVKNRSIVWKTWSRNAFLFVPLLMVWLAFLAIQYLFMTYTFPRYLFLNSLFLAIVFAFMLHVSPFPALLKAIASGLVIVLLCIQIFFNIDPFTKYLFKNVSMSEKQILTSSVSVIGYSKDGYRIHTGKTAEPMSLSPYAEHNRQWGYFDMLMEKILQEIDYSKGTVVMLPNVFKPISTGPFLGYSENNYYDKETGKILQDYTEHGDDRDYSAYVRFDPIIATNKQSLPAPGTFDRLYYVDFYFDDEFGFNDSFIFNRCTVLNEKEISTHGWKATVYELSYDNAKTAEKND